MLYVRKTDMSGSSGVNNHISYPPVFPTGCPAPLGRGSFYRIRVPFSGSIQKIRREQLIAEKVGDRWNDWTFDHPVRCDVRLANRKARGVWPLIIFRVYLFSAQNGQGVPFFGYQKSTTKVKWAYIWIRYVYIYTRSSACVPAVAGTHASGRSEGVVESRSCLLYTSPSPRD